MDHRSSDDLIRFSTRSSSISGTRMFRRSRSRKSDSLARVTEPQETIVGSYSRTETNHESNSPERGGGSGDRIRHRNHFSEFAVAAWRRRCVRRGAKSDRVLRFGQISRSATMSELTIRPSRRSSCRSPADFASSCPAARSLLKITSEKSGCASHTEIARRSSSRCTSPSADATLRADSLRKLRDLPGQATRKLGERVVAGRKVIDFSVHARWRGVESHRRRTRRNCRSASKSRTPIESEGKSIREVTTDFVFDASLDSSLFQIVPPEGLHGRRGAPGESRTLRMPLRWSSRRRRASGR